MTAEQLAKSLGLVEGRSVVVINNRVVQETRAVRGAVDSTGRFWTEEQIERAIVWACVEAERLFLETVLRPAVTVHFIIL